MIACAHVMIVIMCAMLAYGIIIIYINKTLTHIQLITIIYSGLTSQRWGNRRASAHKTVHKSQQFVLGDPDSLGIARENWAS